MFSRDALLRVLNDLVLPLDGGSLRERDLELPVELALHPKLHSEELVPLAEDHVSFEATGERRELPLEIVESVFDVFRPQRLRLPVRQIDHVGEFLDLRGKSFFVFSSEGDGSSSRRFSNQIFFRRRLLTATSLFAAVAGHCFRFFNF